MGNKYDGGKSTCDEKITAARLDSGGFQLYALGLLGDPAEQLPVSQRRGHISSCLCRSPVSQSCRCRARTACGRLSLWVSWLPAVTWTCCWGEWGECSPPSVGSGESTQLGWGQAWVSQVGNQPLVELTSGFSFLCPVSDCVKPPPS